jgi:phosphatidylglycerophosphatase A
VVGFAYAAALLRLPSGVALATASLVIVLSIWSAGVCERLLGKKDPGQVVIDEIASIPFALWPLLSHPHPPGWIWVAAFVLFRVFDIAKPFPIKQLQCIHGGLGILVDDIVAALFTSAIVWVLLFCR